MSVKNEVIRILMERDGMTEKEVCERYEEVAEMLAYADPWEVEDILADELGLEMDYIFDFID